MQCYAVCCSVLQGVAVFCSALQCVAVCCCALQCVAVCCSVLQCVPNETAKGVNQKGLLQTAFPMNSFCRVNLVSS